MLTKIKNILSGKNKTYYDTFRVPYYQLRQALDQLNPPSNPVEVAFIQRTRGYLEETSAFTHTLFYGFSQGAAVCSDAELRALGQVKGERLFCLLFIALIRYSLMADHEIGDRFWAIASNIIPESVGHAAERLSSTLRVPLSNGCDSVLIDILGQFIPRVTVDPRSLAQFLVYISAFAGSLHERTFAALSTIDHAHGIH